MNRRRQAWISAVAAVLSGLLVYGVYLLQLRQIELRETMDIVAPKQFVPAGTALTDELLMVVPLPREVVTAGMIGSLSEANGMETVVPLGGGEPILRWKVGKYRLLPKLGEATFQIPKDYVKSVSNGIRAGDEVSVYLSDSTSSSRRLFSDPIRVAAVKTASNQEIDNPRNPNVVSMADGDEAGMYASRRDANGTIDSINLNLTENEWLLLDSACKTGTAKLVIAFQASSIEEGDQ
jgi:Flp pilus assembly protein CpaB